MYIRYKVSSITKAEFRGILSIFFSSNFEKCLRSRRNVLILKVDGNRVRLECGEMEERGGGVERKEMEKRIWCGVGKEREERMSGERNGRKEEIAGCGEERVQEEKARSKEVERKEKRRGGGTEQERKDREEGSCEKEREERRG